MTKPILNENVDISNINFDKHIVIAQYEDYSIHAINTFYGENILTESFIEKYKDKVYWSYICVFQNLTEEFIEKHIDKINYRLICVYQKLSNKFITKHFDNLRISWLKKNKNIDQEFIKKLELLK